MPPKQIKGEFATDDDYCSGGSPPPPRLEPSRPPTVGDKVALFDGSYWLPQTVVGVDDARGRLNVRPEWWDAHTSQVLADGYGPRRGQWRYAEEVQLIPDLELQLISTRAGFHGSSPVPDCPNCGRWPCAQIDGCPDYLTLAYPGYKAENIPQHVRILWGL